MWPLCVTYAMCRPWIAFHVKCHNHSFQPPKSSTKWNAIQTAPNVSFACVLHQFLLSFWISSNEFPTFFCSSLSLSLLRFSFIHSLWPFRFLDWMPCVPPRRTARTPRNGIETLCAIAVNRWQSADYRNGCWLHASRWRTPYIVWHQPRDGSANGHGVLSDFNELNVDEEPHLD